MGRSSDQSPPAGGDLPRHLFCRIDNQGGNRNSLTLGLFEDEELIGLSMGSIMHWYTGTEYNISEFCIKTKKQGQGMGTVFIKEMEEYVMKNKRVTQIFLQTERTVPAYGFYRKEGFVELKDYVSFFKQLH